MTTSKISVCCLWVQGNVNYGPRYVENLRAMVKKHIGRPFDFHLFTDEHGAKVFSKQINDDFRIRVVDNVCQTRAWWNKIHYFKPDTFPEGQRVVAYDLDVLLVSPQRSIINHPSPMALIPHAGAFKGKGRLKTVPNYNSSVMVWDAGQFTDIYTELFRHDLQPINRLWGDQDWIGELYPDLHKLPLSWFPRISDLIKSEAPTLAPITDDVRVILCKKPKNDVAVKRWPELLPIWKGE